jgi:hypothetical protein
VKTRQALLNHAAPVWEFRSPKDIQRFWEKAQHVPRRTQGRAKKQMERYYAALYLLLLAENGLLSYPFELREEESPTGELPDFMMMWPSGEAMGLEVTRAAENVVQAAMTHVEKQHPDGALLVPNPAGYAADKLERAFCDLVRRIVEKKIQDKFSKYKVSQCYLLVHDESSIGAGDRRKTVEILKPWARDLKQREPKLGKLSIVASLDVLYDVGGESRVFHYINWSAPDETDSMGGETFSERIERAGQIAAEKATAKLRGSDIPIYLMYGDRLVKEIPNGRLFEVRIDNDGNEVVVKALPSP